MSLPRPGLLLAVVALAAGVILAQSTPEPESDLSCDRDELLATQTELHTLLDDFESDLDEDIQATLSQLYEVGKTYQELAIECGFIPEDIGERFVGTDIDTILRALEDVNGDPLNGQLIYNNEAPIADGTEAGCIGCHNDETIAPPTAGTWTRWDEIRSLEPQFEDYTFEHYVVESVVNPWAYLVPDYGQVMPNNFGNRLSYQDLADLIAYLSSQDQFLD